MSSIYCRRSQRNRRTQATRRLRTELLEDRRLLAGVTVNNALDAMNAPDTSSISALVTNDGGDGISLREAIHASNNDGGADTISFDTGVFSTPQTITLGGTELLITDAVTINGPGQDLLTIDGAHSSRIFNIDDGNSGNFDVTLSDMTIRGGAATIPETRDGGGGIRFASTGNLAITRSTITDNAVGPDSLHTRGGGIASLGGGTLDLVQSTISNNRAQQGGGISVVYGNLNLMESTVSGNAVGHTGGTNSSPTSGGGMFLQYAATEVIDSTVSANAVSFARSSNYTGGGGILNYNSSLSISGSTISGNVIAQESGASGYTYVGGGGISNVSGSLIARHTTITNNGSSGSSDGTYGGYGGGVFNNNGSVTLEHTILAGNSASLLGNDLVGGATSSYSLVQDTVGATINDNGGTITGVAANLGPLQDNGGPTLTHMPIAGSVVIDLGDPAAMSGVGTTPQNDQRGNPYTRVRTGRIDIGAVEGFGDLMITVDTATDVADGNFSVGNLSLREAIEIANSNPGVDVITFDASVFNGEPSDVIRLQSGQLVITEAVHIDAGSQGVVISGDANGDDTLTSDPTGNPITDVVNNTDFVDNTRVFSITGGSSTLAGLVLTGGSSTAGGAINVSDGATLSVRDSSISGNMALGDGAFYNGGAIHNSGTLNLAETTVAGNSAKFSGGGIYNAPGGVATLASTAISDNNAANNGGGIANAGSMTAVNTTVAGNHAQLAAGINNSNGANLNVANSTVTANSGPFFPGIETSQATLTLTNSIVAGNSSFTSELNGTPVLVGGNIVGGTLSIDGAPQQTGIMPADLFAAIDAANGGGQLADNGGVVQTVALKPNAVNPALDSGSGPLPADTLDLDGDADTSEPLPVDARGQNRSVDLPTVGTVAVDLGAYEQQTIGDFDNDGDLDGSDIDSLQANIVAGLGDPAVFDLTGDGQVNLADRDLWLAIAGAVNLPSGNPFLLGDANLDGVVDGQDFIRWNNNKFTASSAWTRGDFSLDGVVDGQDFLIWNDQKFMAADAMASPNVGGAHRLRDLALVNLFGEEELIVTGLPAEVSNLSSASQST